MAQKVEDNKLWSWGWNWKIGKIQNSVKKKIKILVQIYWTYVHPVRPPLPDPNTNPNSNPKLTQILTLFSCFMLFFEHRPLIFSLVKTCRYFYYIIIIITIFIERTNSTKFESEALV